MIYKLIIVAFTGAGIYNIINTINKTNWSIDDLGLCSPEIEEIYQCIGKYQNDHPDCELSFEQLFAAFSPQRIMKQRLKKRKIDEIEKTYIMKKVRKYKANHPNCNLSDKQLFMAFWDIKPNKE